MNLRSISGPVPLGELLKREGIKSEKVIEHAKCELLYGEFCHSKKGEDFTLIKADCERDEPGDSFATFSVFAIFDGHGGKQAAIYSKEKLLGNILNAIPSNLTREEWLAALPRAFVSGFVKTDKDLQDEVRTSGTTVTFVIIDGMVITVGSVGDSRAVLESAEGSLYHLSADHRLEENEEEVERVKASGGDVAKFYPIPNVVVGPLRCWPGGLCLSRSIGDLDVGEFIVPVPYVKQVKLSSGGGRLIISSDGVWDAISPEMAFNCSKGLTPDAASSQVVKDAVQLKGLRDDTTCIVVDVLPQEKATPTIVPHTKKHGMNVFKHIFKKKTSDSCNNLHDLEYQEPDVVEEIFEEGSACLAERLETEFPIKNIFKVFACAICQVELKPNECISVHSEILRSGSHEHGMAHFSALIATKRRKPWKASGTLQIRRHVTTPHPASKNRHCYAFACPVLELLFGLCIIML